MAYFYLAAAIIAEVIATSALKASAEFTKPVPSIVVVAGYVTAFYLLSLVLRTMNVGTAYALWCGLGIVLVTVAGTVLYKQVPDIAALVGMGLIILGAAVISLFSSTTSI